LVNLRNPDLFFVNIIILGITYISFRLSDGKATSGGMEIEVGEDKGFTFGINGDEAHYITGDGSSSTSKRYTCKRK
jgi:hypothetical protein